MTRIVPIALLLCAAACEKVLTVGTPPDLAFAKEQAWRTADAPMVDYYAVSGSGANDVIIVGSGGTILRWNGTMLATEMSGTTKDLRSVIAVTPMLAYAVGESGTILRWDGTSWKSEMLPEPPADMGPPPDLSTPIGDGGIVDAAVGDAGMQGPPFLTAVWADATRAFAVGQAGAVFSRTASGAWLALPAYEADGVNPATEDLYSVLSAANKIIATGTLGSVLTYDGTASFVRAEVGGTNTIAGATSGPDGTFLVGLGGELLSYPSGKAVTSTLPNSFVRAVADLPNGDLFVVGWDDLIARVRNGNVLVYPAPETVAHWYYGVWGDATGDLWIVGTSGTILRGPPALDPVVGDGGIQADGGSQ